ncbi:putative serine/threonine-protein kinase mkcA [Fusarium oxysporum f. sp. albedinis]|nr:putative serine/threonine-protein kinase mkcA [Fusarium oxysporum f. sp. albedinis]
MHRKRQNPVPKQVPLDRSGNQLEIHCICFYFCCTKTLHPAAIDERGNCSSFIQFKFIIKVSLYCIVSQCADFLCITAIVFGEIT